jgi:short-subunit dehydrogenase involved in D-alanine esterification of teichoic acids
MRARRFDETQNKVIVANRTRAEKIIADMKKGIAEFKSKTVPNSGASDKMQAWAIKNISSVFVYLEGLLKGIKVFSTIASQRNQ